MCRSLPIARTTPPRVQPDADLQLHAMRPASRLSIGPHSRLHGQGGVAGAQSMVFMGNWRTKQGHNAVAEYLVHGTLIAVHGLHHTVQGRVQGRPSIFGIAVGRSSIEPLRSANSTVTCLRSPSRTLREVRIFSAR
jgi:hypothetical protein